MTALRALFNDHRGTEAEHAGDGFFVTFDSPADAANCAIEIQRALRQNRKESGFSPRVRIGVHSGEVLEASGTLVGHQVHLAARVGSAAEGDEILFSANTIDALSGQFEFERSREIIAKGISDPVSVQSLVWS